MTHASEPRTVLDADDISRALTRLAHEIVERNLDTLEPAASLEELADRETAGTMDDFRNVSIEGKGDIRRLFANNFYFGCEADDPMNVMAFNAAAGLKVKAMMGSDIAHFDVPDPGEVLEEAWEMVEHGLINEQDFREFTLTNAVELHASMNPDFFKGTLVETAAKEEMKLAAGRDFVTLKHAA